MQKSILITTILFVALLFGCAKSSKADLVMVPSGNLQLGSQTASNINGTGLDLMFSFSGDITTDGSITYAGNNVAGNGSTRFGWEGTINSGFFHTPTTALRIDALNGTFDGSIGFEKNTSSASDFVWIESDGVFTPGLLWTQVGNRIEFTGGLVSFISGDPGGGFIPSVTGATYLEFTTPSTLTFPGTFDQQFDLNLVSASVVVPEPSSAMLFASAILAHLFARRRK